MPPKNNNTSWRATRIASSPFMGNTAGTGWNAPEPPVPVVRGLAELVEILDAMAASPLGARPKSNQDLMERIKTSPLEPVLKSLTIVYQKLGPLEGSPEHLQAQAAQSASTPGPGPSSAQKPTPAAAPATAGIKKTEADLKSVSSKLHSVSQAVTDMKDSAKSVKTQLEAAKDRAEAVEQKVSQISANLDPALAELAQEVKKLEVDLIDEFNGERTCLETKVKGLKKDVNKLEGENQALEQETKKLQKVIRDTRAELLPVEVASEVALQGTFSDEPDKTCGPEGPAKAPDNLVQTAKNVRTNVIGLYMFPGNLTTAWIRKTLALITKCRALFAIINPDIETDANAPDISMEGEWGRCAEHLRTSNSKLRNAVVEKEQIVQNLQLVSLVLDQVRRGHDVQLVTQASPRPTGQPGAASNGPASSAAPGNSEPSTAGTIIAVSQARTSLSELNTCGYLS